MTELKTPLFNHGAASEAMSHEECDFLHDPYTKFAVTFTFF